MSTKKTTAAPAPPQTEYARAIDKLRDEMAREKGRYIQVVGEYLTEWLLNHPEAEAAILAKDKTIKGSLKAMQDEARKHKEGNVAILDDATAFGVVLKYFGIEEGETTSSVTADAVPPSPKGEGKTAAAADSESLPLQGKVPPEGADEVVPAADPFDLDALIASGSAELSQSALAAPGETRDAKRGGATLGVM